MNVYYFGAVRPGTYSLRGQDLAYNMATFTELGTMPKGKIFSGDELGAVVGIFEQALSQGGLIFSSKSSSRLVGEPYLSALRSLSERGFDKKEIARDVVKLKLDDREMKDDAINQQARVNIIGKSIFSIFPGLAKRPEDALNYSFSFRSFNLESVIAIEATAGGQKVRNFVEGRANEMGLKYEKIMTPEDGRGNQPGVEIFKVARLEPAHLVIVQTSRRAGLAISSPDRSAADEIRASVREFYRAWMPTLLEGVDADLVGAR